MNSVEFTQYLLPRGNKRTAHIDVDDETYAKAQQIIDKGHRFECEVLRTGHCSFTITGHDEEEGEELDLAIKICSNGPRVPETVKALIMEFEL